MRILLARAIGGRASFSIDTNTTDIARIYNSFVCHHRGIQEFRAKSMSQWGTFWLRCKAELVKLVALRDQAELMQDVQAIKGLDLQLLDVQSQTVRDG